MKSVLQALLILLIVATISICAIQPDLHKNVMVYDSDYTLVSEEDVKTETKNIPVMEMPVKPVNTTIAVEKKIIPQETVSKVQVKTVNNKTTSTPVKTTAVKQTAVKKTNTQTISKPKTTINTKPVSKEVTKTESPKIVEQKIAEPKSVNQNVVKTVTEQPKVLTQQEETIAWNIWRSNLTNKIMQDTRLPDLPNGVLFQFSFTVDKYGKVTNVQTGANPSNYTPYAIQYIAPVIRGYQGKSILNFPEGTQRTVTQVSGKWRISNTEKYSTPQDYNDLERVIR